MGFFILRKKTNNMKIETLKTLIGDAFDNDNLMVIMSNETTALLMKVMKVIDLYEEDNDQPFIPTPGFNFSGPIPYEVPDEVPYGTICPCNPSNGGSGICGCIMGNQMVPNPKKYGIPKTNLTTGTDTIINKT